MRIFNSTLATTFAFTIVLAGELPDADILELEEDEADDFDDADLALEDGDRILEAQKCKETATSADEWCWFRSNNYQALEGWEKLEELQKKIKGSLTDKSPELMWTENDQFFKQRANVTFCVRSDETRKKRPKSTHTEGLTAAVEWKVFENDLGYSSIYKTGSKSVLMRLSETANLFEGSDGLTPSIALKFLVKDKESQNIVAMESFMPSTSWNFLDPVLSNRVKPFDTSSTTGYIMDETLRKKMVEGSQRPFGVGIAHIGQITNEGKKLEKGEVNVPYQLFFKAPDALRGDLSDEEKFDADGKRRHWTKHVQDAVGPGGVIYDVMAKVEPEDDQLVKIAEIRLMEELQISKWADERLFFRHQRIARDRKFWKRTWKQFNEDVLFDKKDPEQVFGDRANQISWPKEEQQAKELYEEQMTTWGCPFEHFMPAGWFKPE